MNGPSEWLIGAGIVLVLLLIAGPTRALDAQGLFAAVGLGLIVGVLGHWTYLLLLLSFLVLGHFVTKFKFDEKKRLGVVESSDGSRSWPNVLANGGVVGLLSLIALLIDDRSLIWPAVTASVAVAAADTFASEIGTTDNRVWMITTMKRCNPGTNGGFSITGQFAAFMGSGLVIIFAAILSWLESGEIGSSKYLISLTIIGWLGCQLDSILGALLENRGLIDKNSVNLASITIGAVAALVWVNR